MSNIKCFFYGLLCCTVFSTTLSNVSAWRVKTSKTGIVTSVTKHIDKAKERYRKHSFKKSLEKGEYRDAFFSLYRLGARQQKIRTTEALKKGDAMFAVGGNKSNEVFSASLGPYTSIVLGACNIYQINDLIKHCEDASEQCEEELNALESKINESKHKKSKHKIEELKTELSEILFIGGILHLINSFSTESDEATKAVKHFERAASLGNASAQYALGIMHYYGFNMADVEKNEAKAVEYFTSAANNLGSADAMLYLAKIYYTKSKPVDVEKPDKEKKKELKKNKDEAMKWMKKAGLKNIRITSAILDPIPAAFDAMSIGLRRHVRKDLNAVPRFDKDKMINSLDLIMHI